MKRSLLYLVVLLIAGCSNSAWNNLQAGIESYNKRDYDAAHMLFERSLKDDPQIPDTYYYMGNLFRDWKGEQVHDGVSGYEHAIKFYNKAIEIKQDYILSYKNRADLYKQLKKYEEAITGYQQVLKLNPNSAPVYESLSHIARERYDQTKDRKHLEEAIKNLIKAIENDIENPNLYRKRGELDALEGNYHKAIEDYTKAIEIVSRQDPNRGDFQALMARGKAYMELKKYEEAFQDFNLCEKKGFQNEEVSTYRKKALRLRNQGKE